MVVVFRVGLEGAVKLGLEDVCPEGISAYIIRSGAGKGGLFGQMGIALSPEGEDRPPDDVNELLYPSVSCFVGIRNFGEDAVGLCPGGGETAVEGVLPA